MSKNAQAGLAAALVAVVVGGLLLALLGGEPDAPGIGITPGAGASGEGHPGPAGLNPTAGPTGATGLGRPSTNGGGTTPGNNPNGSGARDPNTPYNPKRFGHQTKPGQGGPKSLVFVCTDGEGAPLAGVRIEARRRSGMPLTPVVSDGRGRATIGGLPGGERISGVARHPRSLPLSFGPVTVAGNAQVPLRFGAAPMGRLTGVLQNDAGAPITAGAELVLGDGKGGKGSAVLDATALNLRPDGGFSADLAAGTYAISARGKGLSESDKSYVTIEAGRTAGPITLIVQRQGSISGQVDLPTDLQNIADLKLDLVIEITGGTDRNPYTNHDRRSLKLDGSNRFVLEECDQGRYRVRLEVPQPGGNRVGPWVRFQLKPGKPVTGVRLNLAEVMISVQGTVSDQEGRGIEGATVSVRGKKVTTDRSGGYALRGLSMGSLGIKGDKKGFASDYKNVTYNGSRLTVNLVLKQHGAITGRVTANQTKVSGLAVVAVSKDEDGYMTFNGTTDAQGYYRIDGLAPGTYSLKAGPGARDPYKVAGAPSVKVEAGRAAKAPDIVLP